MEEAPRSNMIPLIAFMIWALLAIMYCYVSKADLQTSTKVMWLVAIAVEGYVMIAADQATEAGNKMLTWMLNNSCVWPEGIFYKNLEVWKSRGSGLWPSITDNLCQFFRIVVGPRATIVVWVMTPTGVICLCANQALVWMRHLHKVLDLNGMNVVHSHDDEPIGKFVLEPSALCDALGYVPMPYSYVIVKLVLTSFLQDAIFGSGDLFGTKKDKLKFVSIAFTFYQVVTVILCYVQGANHAIAGDFGETLWDMYSGFVFFCLNHASCISLILLLVKVFWETNVVDHGAPPGLSRLLQNRVHMPPFDYPKAKLFWSLCALFAIPLLPAICTHLAPAFILFLLIAIAFPLWGSPVYLLSVVASAIGDKVEPLGSFLHTILVYGGMMHAESWGVAAVLLFMTLVGTYLRKSLWELTTRWQLWSSGMEQSGRAIQVADKVSVMWNEDGNYYNAVVLSFPVDHSSYKVEWDKASIPQGVYEQEEKCVRLIWGPEPHGPYGFNLACYTLLFSTPMFFLTGLLLSASIALYSGASFSSGILVGSFNSHQLRAYNACMLQEVAPLGQRLTEWFSLI